MPYNTKAVANYLLDLATARGIELTPMKLQKLIYFAHGWHLSLSQGNPLIEEPVEAWQYGPVVGSLYHEFKHYGNGPIKNYAQATDLQTFNRYIPVLADADKQQLHVFLNSILDIYGPLSAIQLSNMTHEFDTPWARTWASMGGLRSNQDIDDASIKEYFDLKAQAPAAQPN